MESWFIYAVFSVLFSGLFTFVQKYGTHNNLNSHEFTRWLLMGQLVSSAVLWGAFGFSLLAWPSIAVVSVILGCVYTLIHLLRALSLEHIDTTIYFPISKFLGPTLVAIGGVVFLGDSLSLYEYIGVGLGVLVPLLLLDASESHRQKNLPQGMRLLIVGTVISAGALFLARYVAVGEGDLWLFILGQSLVGIMFLLVSQKQTRTKNTTKLAVSGNHRWVALGGGVTNALGIYCILASFEEGLISIAYTINSFYILIPIVLSVWLYHEHMNMRKALAIGLSVVAVIFFQI